MGAGEIIAIIITALIVGGALAYIIKAKKSGKKCIGCPNSGTCGKKCCNCNSKEDKKDN